MKAAELYQRVTERIIAELAAGVAPWTKPWTSGGGAPAVPRNAASGRAYSGINVLILWDAADCNCYPRHEWLTFQQARAAGAYVRKGEKGTTVVFTKPVTVESTIEDEEDRIIRVLRTFTVFNVAQVEGLPDTLGWQPVPAGSGHVQTFVEATGAIVKYAGLLACYLPSQDVVLIPPAYAFESTATFQATLLHELCHWTGHEHRLGRDLRNRFGTRAYAAEELVAEFGAAFLCAQLGVEGRLRHAEYIGSWLDLLRDDDRAVFTAASQASHAAAFLCSFTAQPDPPAD